MLATSVLLPLLEGLAAGLVVAFLVNRYLFRQQQRARQELLEAARQEAARIRADAQRAVDAARQEVVLAGKQELLQLREEVDREGRQRREEWDRHEARLEERSRELDRRAGNLGNREGELNRRERGVAERERALEERERAAEQVLLARQAALERVAGLTVEEARREVLQRAEDEARGQAAALIRDVKEQARRTAEREGRQIVAYAAQRLASETSAESTVSSVLLASDELKGRIIGREGRNIRAFEQATGVDVIIDDTPDTVVISCFEPMRREVARRALEVLITDGRIHPGRIEEVVAKVRREVEQQTVELGERAAYDLGIHGLHPELVKLVGRMHFRTSYGQNILEHSREVAWLAGMMAAELRLDVRLARRGGLLHDVGKVLTHDNEGTHVELGVEVARKYGEKPDVIGCIAAHHDDVPHATTESVLVQAADAISGARPGARREAFESYVKRLTKLEELAEAFAGVEKCSVIQAGREVRVVVTPEKVSDTQATELAEQIARRIEDELQYPGQIRVVVIRETRAVGVAK